MKINPFSPNSPSGTGMFAGRLKEIETIEQILLQTRADKGHGFLLLGQRGIGKTSLLNLVKFQAEGDIKVENYKLIKEFYAKSSCFKTYKRKRQNTT